jgi:hypothetical protein
MEINLTENGAFLRGQWYRQKNIQHWILQVSHFGFVFNQ